jgi:hypothetical protein
MNMFVVSACTLAAGTTAVLGSQPVSTTAVLAAAPAAAIAAQPATIGPALLSTVIAADPAPIAAGSDFFTEWKRSIDLGLNGSECNSQHFSGRGAVGATRTAQHMVTKAGISYVYGTSDSKKNKSRGEAFVRNDWVFTESPSGVFAQGKVEFDEFQEWDWRANFVVDPNYQLIKNGTTSLKLRAGLGGSYARGGTVKEEFRPEAMCLAQTLNTSSPNTRRSRLSSSITPAWMNFLITALSLAQAEHGLLIPSATCSSKPVLSIASTATPKLRTRKTTLNTSSRSAIVF